MTTNPVQFSPFVDGYCDVENQLSEYLSRRAETFFSKEKSGKDSILRREDFEERKRKVQEYFLEAIGGLPSKRISLNAEVRGTIEREQYTIEKVIFESLPRFYVTSLLYAPRKIEEPMPGILFVCGHSRPAKAYPTYQKVCIDLVKNGFTVLAIDPLGQGERLQYWDPKSKSEIVRWGTTEHSYFGLQCILIGDSIARYFIWDGIRGIDYLASREEVDGERIGVTGNSGGGTQTAYLMMTDPRIKVAAPCTYITSLEALLRTIGPQDAEQNIFGAIREGLNHDDYISTFAPKPVLIGAAAYDYFAIEGTLQTFERAKKVYRLYNAEENVALHVGRHTHMYSDDLREAVVNWFRIHLKGEPPNFKTGGAETEPEDLLNVTSSGQILGEVADAKTGFDLNAEHWAEKKPNRTVIKNEDDLRQYTSKVCWELRRLLNITEARAPIYPRVIATVDWDGLKVEKIFFFSEPEIALTAFMIYDEAASNDEGPLLALFEDGTNELLKHRRLIESLATKGTKVFVLDVRGIGAVRARKTSSQRTEFKFAYDSYLLGTSLLGMRTYDVLRGIDYLRSRTDLGFEQLGLYAKGQAAIYGLFTAALSPDVRHVTLEDLLYSYESLVKTRVYRMSSQEPPVEEHRPSLSFESILVNGILEHFDIVDLFPLLHGRRYEFVNPTDAKQETASIEELEQGWFSVATKYYPMLEPLRQSVSFKE